MIFPLHFHSILLHMLRFNISSNSLGWQGFPFSVCSYTHSTAFQKLFSRLLSTFFVVLHAVHSSLFVESCSIFSKQSWKCLILGFSRLFGISCNVAMHFFWPGYCTAHFSTFLHFELPTSFAGRFLLILLFLVLHDYS